MGYTCRITSECVSCGACEPECPYDCISEDSSNDKYVIDSECCCFDGCGGWSTTPCMEVCPAIAIVRVTCGST